MVTVLAESLDLNAALKPEFQMPFIKKGIIALTLGICTTELFTAAINFLS